MTIKMLIYATIAILYIVGLLIPVFISKNKKKLLLELYPFIIITPLVCITVIILAME